MVAFQRIFAIGALVGLATTVMFGCATATSTPTTTAPNSQQVTQDDNFIRRNEGAIIGRVHVAVVQMDAESTSNAIRELGRWSDLVRPYADINVIVDRSVSPRSLTTKAPLLLIPAEPNRHFIDADFWTGLVRYMDAGGTVLFTHGDVPTELSAQGIWTLGKSNPVLKTPYEINPTASFRSEYVDVRGQAAALDVASLTALSPALRVNIIAHVIRRHPGGSNALVTEKPTESSTETPTLPDGIARR